MPNATRELLAGRSRSLVIEGVAVRRNPSRQASQPMPSLAVAALRGPLSRRYQSILDDAMRLSERAGPLRAPAEAVPAR